MTDIPIKELPGWHAQIQVKSEETRGGVLVAVRCTLYDSTGNVMTKWTMSTYIDIAEDDAGDEEVLLQQQQKAIDELANLVDSIDGAGGTVKSEQTKKARAIIADWAVDE